MKFSINSFLSQLLAVVIITSSTVSIQAFNVEMQQNYQGIDRIKINTISGDLKLVKSLSGDVEVSVTSSYDEDEMKMIMEQSGSRLILKEKSVGYGSSSGNSSWIVAIPEGIEIEISYNSASGDFLAQDITASFSLNTASGDIELQNYSGTARGNTASGNITLDKVKGKIRLNTASGDITISSAEGAFNLNTASGDVEVSSITFTDESSFQSASGDVEVSLDNSPQYDLELQSASGNVELDMQGNLLEGFISMTTRKGYRYDINAPFEFDNEEITTRHKKEYIEKTVTLGNAAVNITLATSTGDATIKE